MDETVDILSKSVVLWLLFVGSLHLVEDAKGLLVLGLYVFEVYLGVRCSNSRSRFLSLLGLKRFPVFDVL